MRSRFWSIPPMALLLVGLISGAGSAQAPGANGAPSSPSRQRPADVPDPYFPGDGNRGYDVLRYHVALDYFRPTQTIAATTSIRARAADRLRSFHLDLLGLRVSAVTVAGAPADFRRAGAHELIITPRRPVHRGDRFVTRVTYSGKPGQDPVGPVPSGWFDGTTRGAGFLAGEPHSCTLWYPCNDHPTDKARFALTATVPRPFKVISNGHQLPTTSGTRAGVPVRTYRWRLDEPTATYLTTMYVDRMTLERSRLRDGTPVVSAYGPGQGEARQLEAHLPQVLQVLARRWGPYPAPQAGGIFVAGQVPFSLETFTRPLYSEGVQLGTVVHENAHQWWGDNVSVERWRDICLNECLASYSQWLWDGHQGADLDQYYRQGVAGDPNLFDAALYDMGPDYMFDFNGVYYKGQYFLHALRNKVGDGRFFRAMRAIQRDRAGGNLSMVGLRNQLERRTGVDLTSFWREWVFETGRPSRANLFPGDL